MKTIEKEIIAKAPGLLMKNCIGKIQFRGDAWAIADIIVNFLADERELQGGDILLLLKRDEGKNDSAFGTETTPRSAHVGLGAPGLYLTENQLDTLVRIAHQLKKNKMQLEQLPMLQSLIFVSSSVPPELEE